jgi:hypothetical protein
VSRHVTLWLPAAWGQAGKVLCVYCRLLPEVFFSVWRHCADNRGQWRDTGLSWSSWNPLGIEIRAFWDVAPRGHQGDYGGSTHLWNVGLLQQDYTALHPRRHLKYLMSCDYGGSTHLWNVGLLQQVNTTLHVRRHLKSLMRAAIYWFQRSILSGR